METPSNFYVPRESIRLHVYPQQFNTFTKIPSYFGIEKINKNLFPSKVLGDYKFQLVNKDFKWQMTQLAALILTLHDQPVSTAEDFAKLKKWESQLHEWSNFIESSGLIETEKKEVKKIIKEASSVLQKTMDFANELEIYTNNVDSLYQDMQSVSDHFGIFEEKNPFNIVTDLKKCFKSLNNLETKCHHSSEQIIKIFNKDRVLVLDLVDMWEDSLKDQMQEEWELTKFWNTSSPGDKVKIYRQIEAYYNESKKLKEQLLNCSSGHQDIDQVLQNSIYYVEKEHIKIENWLNENKIQCKTLKYGNKDWKKLVQSRPTSKPGFISNTITQLTNPEKWSDSTKQTVHNVFVGLMLSQQVFDIYHNLSRVPQKSQADALQKEVLDAVPPTTKEAISKERAILGLLLSDKYSVIYENPAVIPALTKNNPNLILAAEQAIQQFGSIPPNSQSSAQYSNAYVLRRMVNESPIASPFQHRSFGEWYHLFAESENEVNAIKPEPLPLPDYLGNNTNLSAPTLTSTISSYLKPFFSIMAKETESVKEILKGGYQSLQETQRDILNTSNHLFSIPNNDEVLELQETLKSLYSSISNTANNTPHPESSLLSIALWMQEVEDKKFAAQVIEKNFTQLAKDHSQKSTLTANESLTSSPLEEKASQVAANTPVDSKDQTASLQSAEEIKHYITSSSQIVLTKKMLEKIIPQGFLELINQNQPGSVIAWNADPQFDPEILPELLKAFKEKRVKSIETEGKSHEKLTYSSRFERDLHMESQDIHKAKIISQAFKESFTHLPKEDQKRIAKVLVTYVDFIGVRKENIFKIMTKEKTVKQLFESDENKQVLDNFLNKISTKMEVIVNNHIVKSDPKMDNEMIVITTTASGGAHLSIASVINENLSKRQIPHVVINEQELVKEDNLKYFVGIARKDVYNKVSQQSQQMTYGKQLKLLDDNLSEFVPDQFMDSFRTAIGNSSLLVSTSHHPENVRAVAENNQRVCFQICDFGTIPSKLIKLAQTVTTFDLSGIEFFVPSSTNVLELGENRFLAPKSNVKFPSIDRKVSEDTEYEELLKNYQKFAKVMKYPVHDSFKNPMSKEDIKLLKKEQGLREEANLWVLTMGSQGVGNILKHYIKQIVEGAAADATRNELEDLDIVLLCGANKSLTKELEAFSNEVIKDICNGDETLHSKLHQKLKFNFKSKVSLDVVARLGKASQAFLSKPGGGTTAEAIAGNFPMIVHKEEKHTWEFGNIAELVQSGATEMKEGDNFYDKAKSANRLQSLNPGLDDPYPNENIDYAIDVLWRIEVLRKKGLPINQ